MNKFLFFITIVLLENLSAAPTNDIITGIISPTNGGKVGTVSITFNVKPTAITKGILIYLSTETTGILIDDPKHEVTNQPAGNANSYSASFQVTVVGKYHVYVGDSSGETIQDANGQPVSIQINAATPDPPTPTPDPPADNLITAISATDPIANTTANFTFTLATDGLLANDKIYLSKADTLGANDVSVTLDKAATGTVVKEFKLVDKGNYSAFVKRGDLSTKQTAKAIEVGSSGFISYALVLILVIFLF